MEPLDLSIGTIGLDSPALGFAVVITAEDFDLLQSIIDSAVLRPSLAWQPKASTSRQCPSRPSHWCLSLKHLNSNSGWHRYGSLLSRPRRPMVWRAAEVTRFVVAATR